jgi:aryl-alcohol dehydrogenase-like predicted oxidoreductase
MTARAYDACMTTRPFGKTGLSVSVLGFGGAPAAHNRADADATAAVVNQLLDAGVNLLDTATNYPGSEPFIGDYLSHRRKDYVLVSKTGKQAADSTTTGEPWSVELITTSIERSLRAMKTDHLDVMMLHTCDLETLQRGDAFGALVKARDAGKVKFIGYAGDNETAAAACLMPDASVVEMSINYCDQANIDAVLPVARANNIGIIAKRPVANAAWLGPTGRPGFYDKYASEYVKRAAAMGITAEEFGFTADQWPELALRFTLSFPEVATAIVGTTNPKNAKANLEAVRKGPLPGDVVERIRAKFRAAPESSTWTGQT